mgnify:CR=1 FL=1
MIVLLEIIKVTPSRLKNNKIHVYGFMGFSAYRTFNGKKFIADTILTGETRTILKNVAQDIANTLRNNGYGARVVDTGDAYSNSYIVYRSVTKSSKAQSIHSSIRSM